MELTRKASGKQPATTDDPSSLVFKTEVSLGVLLPGQSCANTYTIQNKSNQVHFVSLEMSGGNRQFFWLCRKKSDELRDRLNLVVKPGCTERLYIVGHGANAAESTEVKSKARLDNGSESYTVLLSYRLAVPQVLNPKLLKSLTGQCDLMRITINKLVTSQGRINLLNSSDMPLRFELEVYNEKAFDSKPPFILKVPQTPVQAAPGELFTFFVQLSTNIAYKGEHRNFKKVTLRKLLLLKSEAAMIYCLPLEVVVVFVKQPQIKGD